MGTMLGDSFMQMTLDTSEGLMEQVELIKQLADRNLLKLNVNKCEIVLLLKFTLQQLSPQAVVDPEMGSITCAQSFDHAPPRS